MRIPHWDVFARIREHPTTNTWPRARQTRILRLSNFKIALRSRTMKAEECILFSGAANGAEAAFGAAAQRHGVAEVNFTFEGHNDARTRGIRVLTEPELKQGDVNLHYVSRFDAPRISR